MGSKLLVIRIKKLLIAFIEGTIAGNVRSENESFKKPGRMCEMPLRRTGVRHGLQHVIFSGKGLRQSQSLITNYLVPVAEGALAQSPRLAGMHGILQDEVLIQQHPR